MSSNCWHMKVSKSLDKESDSKQSDGKGNHVSKADEEFILSSFDLNYYYTIEWFWSNLNKEFKFFILSDNHY